MGTCYYVINVDRMTAFELDKGPWSEITGTRYKTD